MNPDLINEPERASPNKGMKPQGSVLLGGHSISPSPLSGKRNNLLRSAYHVPNPNSERILPALRLAPAPFQAVCSPPSLEPRLPGRPSSFRGPCGKATEGRRGDWIETTKRSPEKGMAATSVSKRVRCKLCACMYVQCMYVRLLCHSTYLNIEYTYMYVCLLCPHVGLHVCMSVSVHVCHLDQIQKHKNQGLHPPFNTNTRNLNRASKAPLFLKNVSANGFFLVAHCIW